MIYYIIFYLIGIAITYHFTKKRYYWDDSQVRAIVDDSYPEFIVDYISAGNGEEATLVTLQFRNRLPVIELIYKNRVVKVFRNYDNSIYDTYCYDLKGNPISMEEFNELFKNTDLTKFNHMFDCLPYVSY